MTGGELGPRFARVLAGLALVAMAGCGQAPAPSAGPGPAPPVEEDAGRPAPERDAAGTDRVRLAEPDAGAAEVGAPDAAASDGGAPDAAAGDAGGSFQGPVAEGRIVFLQDFEAGMEGITRSPTNLPPDRAQIADDPLGQRGKVMKIVYQAGDRFMTSGGSTHTRSWISNTGYHFPVGSTVHFAWGYMTTSSQIDAAFAQHIRPGGPMWLIEGTGDGSTYVNCRSCGGRANLPVKLAPNRWYDLRVEMTYASGGPIRFFIDGAMVLERRMTVNDPPGQRAHWDGGIYNHAAGTSTRTVYISNLSVGMK